MNDEPIVQRIRAGEPAAFGELFRTHRRRLFKLIHSMVRNQGAAEDIVQETFITAHQKLDTFRGEAGLFTWLAAIAVNHARQHFRKEKLRRWLSLDTVLLTVGLEPAAPDATAPADLKRAIETALRRLPFPQRTAVVLFEMEGMSHEEIAAVLGCPVGTVWSHLSRAKTRLRELLKRDGYETAED